MKKLLISAVIAMLSVGLILPTAVSAAAKPVDLKTGDLVKGSKAAVYMIGLDGKRYVFPSASVYKTWFSDFKGIKTLSADQLSKIDLGGSMYVKPGTKLVKGTTSDAVYAVEPNGKLAKIISPAAATKLYGKNWKKMIVTLPDAFMGAYTKTGKVLDGTKYPEGQLVKYGKGISYVNADGKRAAFVNMREFNKYGFNLKDVVPGLVASEKAAALDSDRTYVRLFDKANSVHLGNITAPTKSFTATWGSKSANYPDSAEAVKVTKAQFANGTVNAFFERGDIKNILSYSNSLKIALYADNTVSFVFSNVSDQPTVGIYNGLTKTLTRTGVKGVDLRVLGKTGQSVVFTRDLIGSKELDMFPNIVNKNLYIDSCATGTATSSSCTAEMLVNRNK